MKLLIVGDIHFSQYSSILRRRGEYYSTRLENCIRSIIWAEGQAQELGCEAIVYLGDFFDKADLNSEELTALSEIQWGQYNIPRYFMVGNHEMGLHDLTYNSVNALSHIPNAYIISKPELLTVFGARLFFLPYVLEGERKTIKQYQQELLSQYPIETQELKHNIIFSHNDLKGIRFGQFESKEGFEIKDIESSCELFINGHLHNGKYITSKILNLGNLTGQNFSEDALEYKHQIACLDTSTMQLDLIENPNAYNFYKFEINVVEDIEVLTSLKDNAILSIKCIESLVPALKERIKDNAKIAEYRIITVPELTKVDQETIQELTAVDHIKAFKEYMIEKLGQSDVLLSELQEIS